MKTIKIIVVLIFVSLSACVNKSADSAGNSSNANMSSAAEPSPNAEKSFVKSNTAVASNTGSGSGKGSGGGGGGSRENQISSNPALSQVSDQSGNTQQSPPVTERKIIRNADLTLEIDSPEDAQQKITSIAKAKGGFVVESTQSSSNAKSTTRDTITMTIRVPAEKFDESLDEIRQTASRVIVETVKGEDVTEEFIDVEARLKAKKSLEAQFLEIMKRANSVEDALNVQRELADVRAEIEKIEGRKRFLENQAALSTIKIQLQSPTAFTHASNGFFDRLKESVGGGFDAAMSFILGFIAFLIAILPFLILIVLPAFLVIRYFWKKQEKQRSASENGRRKN
jgi:hypothetical protein